MTLVVCLLDIFEAISGGTVTSLAYFTGLLHGKAHG